MKTKLIVLLALLYQFDINAQLNTKTDFNTNFNSFNVVHEQPIMTLNKTTANDGDEPIELSYGEGKSAALKSLAVPGWGLFTVMGSTNDAKKIFILAPVCYGAVGFGLYSRFKSKSLYNEYLASTDQTEMNELFAKSSKFFKYSSLSTSIGAGLWIGQAIFTYLYGKKNDEYRDRLDLWKNNENTAFRFTPDYDPFSNSFMVRSSLTINLK